MQLFNWIPWVRTRAETKRQEQELEARYQEALEVSRKKAREYGVKKVERDARRDTYISTLPNAPPYPKETIIPTPAYIPLYVATDLYAPDTQATPVTSEGNTQCDSSSSRSQSSPSSSVSDSGSGSDSSSAPSYSDSGTSSCDTGSSSSSE